MQRALNYDLFISYAEADRAWVRGYLIPALYLTIERIITSDDFAPGAFEIDEFERAVMSSRYTVLVVSAAYIADVWTQFGGKLAAHLSLEEQQNRLIPLRRDNVQVSLQISSRIPLDCRDAANWEREIDKLRNLLNRPAPTIADVRYPHVDDIPCPYPGMVPFKESDARFFCGRKNEIETLVLRLRNTRQMFIIGPSGSGKSSLVFAGLLPKLRQAGATWRIETLALDQQPTRALTDLLQHRPAPQSAVARGRSDQAANQQCLLIVIDQFERLFALKELAEQTRFLEMLQPQRIPDDVRIVCTIRADFYDALMSSVLWPLAETQRFEVAPLRGAALREAIEQPALEVGAYLHAELVQALVKDATDQPGSLLLIQETMQALWDKRQRRFLALQAYEDMSQGGRSGLEIAVEAKADAALSELDTQQKEIARRILLCLVHSSEGCPDVRRRRARHEIFYLINEPQDVDATLEHLIQNRILTISHDDMVEIAHDTLLKGWPQLQRWLEKDRADRLLREDLEEAAARWQAEGRDYSFLIGGAQLEKAQQYAARTTDQLSRTLREFLEASALREGKRQRSRFQGQAAGGALGAALGYSIAFTLAFWSSHDWTINRTLLLTFLFMFPVGQVVGFGIGLGLWLFHTEPRQRIPAAGLIGAVTSGAAYLIALEFSETIEGSVGLTQLAGGALLGVGIGLGAGLPYSRKRRLWGTLLGGVLAALAGRFLMLLSASWSWPITLIAGVVLGGLTGLGLHATAAENNEYATV